MQNRGKVKFSLCVYIFVAFPGSSRRHLGPLRRLDRPWRRRRPCAFTMVRRPSPPPPPACAPHHRNVLRHHCVHQRVGRRGALAARRAPRAGSRPLPRRRSVSGRGPCVRARGVLGCRVLASGSAGSVGCCERLTDDVPAARPTGCCGQPRAGAGGRRPAATGVLGAVGGEQRGAAAAPRSRP